MKTLMPVIAATIALLSCNNPSNTNIGDQGKESTEKQSFFPVTSYIKGQLYEIKHSNVNPLKYTTVGNHTDSVWLKIEDLDEAVKEFLSPEIDSLNLISLFTEKKFLDQTINAYTFSYDAATQLPDTMTLRHWDVYIDPVTGKIRRIYMVKDISNTKMLQLTWQGNKWCKISTIITGQNGASVVEKEEKITWDF